MVRDPGVKLMIFEYDPNADPSRVQVSARKLPFPIGFIFATRMLQIQFKYACATSP